MGSALQHCEFQGQNKGKVLRSCSPQSRLTAGRDFIQSHSLLGENINLLVRGEGRDGAASKDILLEAHK